MIVIDKNKLNDLLEALNQSYQVIVPAKKADLTQFMPLDAVKENGAEIILNENTVLSPKWLYLPQSEGMYAFWAKNKKLEIVVYPAI